MEKFALLNLLNALSSLTPKPAAETEKNGNAENCFNGGGADNCPTPVAAKNVTADGRTDTYPNVMASVLQRHEAIANRIKNKK